MANKKGRHTASKFTRDGNFITNKAGVQVTAEEYREFRNMVKRVNRKRDKMEREIGDRPLFYGNRQLDESRQQLKLMGEEDEIMIRKRSSSLNQFGSRKQFDAFMRQLSRVEKTDYIDYRVRLYKRNYAEAVKRNYAEFPELTKGVLMKIRMMKPEDFKQFLTDDRLAQIRPHYTKDNRLSRLLALREKLGLRSPVEYEDIDESANPDYFY